MFYIQSQKTEDSGVAGSESQAAVISMKDRLIGELIGLARSVEGNEHLLRNSTADIVVKGLLATVTNRDFDDAARMTILDQVEQEKRTLVPDCYHCASPCGRTNGYDMREMWNAGEEISSLKFLILVAIGGIAANVYHSALRGYRDDSIYNYLYKALYSLGAADWSRKDLLSVLQESGPVMLKSIALLEKAYADSSETNEAGDTPY